MTTNTLKTVLAAGVAAFVLAGPMGAAQAQTYTMKIAHLLPPGDPRDLGANKVAELLHADDRCDIQVQVYPSGQLGGLTEINEGVQFGSIEMSVQPTAYMAPVTMLSAIFDFPFFWPTDTERLLQIHKGAGVARLAEHFETHNFVLLDVWHTGFMQWTANEPLNDLDAFNEKIARVMPSALLTERQKLFGLNPVTMPFSETYSALQTGAIAAQENPIPTTFNMKFHEVQSHLTMTSHGTLDQFVSVNKPWWEGLTEDCRTAIREAVAAGNEVTLTETMKQEEAALQAMKDAGMTVVVPTEEERAAMRDVVLPGVRDWWLAQTGDDGAELLALFEADIGN
jgi:tripartite ATP-independent transporter DctP family solute receptor